MDRFIECGFAVCAWGLGIVCIMVILVLPYAIYNEIHCNDWQQEAIEAGHGCYNSRTGEFEWIDWAAAPEGAPLSDPDPSLPGN